MATQLNKMFVPRIPACTDMILGSGYALECYTPQIMLMMSIIAFCDPTMCESTSNPLFKWMSNQHGSLPLHLGLITSDAVEFVTDTLPYQLVSKHMVEIRRLFSRTCIEQQLQLPGDNYTTEQVYTDSLLYYVLQLYQDARLNTRVYHIALDWK